MERIRRALNILIDRISEQNYDESFACYRLWFEITQTHSQKYPDQIFDSLFDNRGTKGISHNDHELIHSTAHLTLRFAGDAESDSTLGPYVVGLQSRLCTKILQEFFEANMEMVWSVERFQGTTPERFLADVNFIARWTNLGYVEEPTIRNHILQSLISHPGRPYDHQVDALIVLFKLAGATFEKYADPSVVDRCFELLRGHYSNNIGRNRLAQVRVVLCYGWLQPG